MAKWDPWTTVVGGGGLTALGVVLKAGIDKWAEARKLAAKRALDTSGIELDHEKAQNAVATEMREELRQRLTEVEQSIAAVREEANTWRARYWAEVEAHATTRISNRQYEAQVSSLKAEQEDFLARIGALEKQVASLQANSHPHH